MDSATADQERQGKGGCGRTYTARPVAPGKTGYRSFFADETGVIRATSEDRAANVSDPPIE